MKERIKLHKAHRLLTPGPLCLLTTRYRGQVNVMTIAWVCPISLEPPLVMMALHPSRLTHDLLRLSEECVLSIPGRPLAEQAVRCGTISGQDADKTKLTGLTLDSGQRVEAPWIHECLAHLECVVVSVLQPGDHTLFIAEIVDAWAEKEAFQDMWLLQDKEVSPLYHLGGNTMCLPGAPLEVTVRADGDQE